MQNKHIVFVWELGGGLGHVAGFAPLAKALLKKDFKISVIAKNVTSANEVLGDLPISIYQAPIHRSNSDKLKVTYSYPEIILGLGYKSVTTLYPLVSAWKNLLVLVKPDLVIADHSPSALLACNILNLKKILIGTGFFSPPAVSPLPSFVSMQVPDKKLLVQHEHQVLEAINGVFKKFNTQPFKNLNQLFKADADFLCTLEELDHYPERGSADYWGPRYDIDIGKKFKWNKAKVSKIFAYIKQETPGFELLFKALISSKQDVVLYIPEASAKIFKECKKSKHITLLGAPANMRQVLEEADMIVCHAGHGVVAAALLNGKRLLLVPSQLEQSMLVYLLAKRRLVAAINPRNENVNYNLAIEFACNNAELGKNIELFKQKYAGFNSVQQLERMVKSCVDILTT